MKKLTIADKWFYFRCRHGWRKQYYINKMKKIIEWFKDKWAWLLTFNNPPTVILSAKNIITECEYEHIHVKGRAIVHVNYINWENNGKQMLPYNTYGHA